MKPNIRIDNGHRVGVVVGVLVIAALALGAFIALQPTSIATPEGRAMMMNRRQPAANGQSGDAVGLSTPTPQVTPSARQSTATELRTRLYETSDVLSAAKRTLANGSPDEMVWAADLVRECYGFISQMPPEANAIRGEVSEPQKAALEELQKRCSGVKTLNWAQRRQLTAELYEAASRSTSAFGQLRAINKRENSSGDTRWSQPDVALIQSALYGNDIVLQREAFNAMLASIDTAAPGGAERRDALLFSLAPEILNRPLSSFEVLETCALRGNCDPTVASEQHALEPLTRTPVERSNADLMRARYREAFEKRMPVQDLLSIR